MIFAMLPSALPRFSRNLPSSSSRTGRPIANTCRRYYRSLIDFYEEINENLGNNVASAFAGGLRPSINEGAAIIIRIPSQLRRCEKIAPLQRADEDVEKISPQLLRQYGKANAHHGLGAVRRATKKICDIAKKVW